MNLKHAFNYLKKIMISFNTIYIVSLFGSFLYFIYEQHLIFSDRVNGKKLFNYIMNFSSIN